MREIPNAVRWVCSSPSKRSTRSPIRRPQTDKHCRLLAFHRKQLDAGKPPRNLEPKKRILCSVVEQSYEAILMSWASCPPLSDATIFHSLVGRPDPLLRTGHVHRLPVPARGVRFVLALTTKKLLPSTRRPFVYHKCHFLAAHDNLSAHRTSRNR